MSKTLSKHVKDWLIFAVVVTVDNLLLSETLFYKFYGLSVIVFEEFFFMFIHIIIHILLWDVIHFQQMYLECMLLFVTSFSFHLTSVWLCMSVVFVVTVQWPIDTNMTSPFSLFINTYPFSMSLKTIHFASYPNLQNTSKIWWLAMKKFEIFSLFKLLITSQLSAMCKC